MHMDLFAVTGPSALRPTVLAAQWVPQHLHLAEALAETASVPPDPETQETIIPIECLDYRIANWQTFNPCFSFILQAWCRFELCKTEAKTSSRVLWSAEPSIAYVSTALVGSPSMQLLCSSTCSSGLFHGALCWKRAQDGPGQRLPL